MFRNRLRLLPVILYVALIFGVSSIPSLSAPDLEIVPSDKIAHAVEYFVLGVLLFKTVGRSVTPSRTAAFALIFAVGVSIAAVDEFYQSFVPGRVMSVEDWYADAVGVALGAGVLIFGGKRKMMPAAVNANEQSHGKTT